MLILFFFGCFNYGFVMRECEFVVGGVYECICCDENGGFGGNGGVGLFGNGENFMDNSKFDVFIESVL